MKHFIIILSIISMVSGMVFAQSAQPIEDGISLTIYNQGTALVQDRRTVSIREGVNPLHFTDVASGIDATSVNFVSLTDPLNTFVLEQNYQYDLVSSDALLQRYIDSEVHLTMTDGSEQVGVLLSAQSDTIIIKRQRDDAILMIDGGNVQDVRFPNLPEGLITRPTLRWLLNAPRTEDQQIELTYLTYGMNWQADYNLLLNPNGTTLDLNGWVTLTNTSGASYPNAQVKLIAGDVNRLPDPTDVMYAEVAPTARAMDEAVATGATQREFYEYQLYELNRQVTVGNNETKQVEFVVGRAVPAQTYYVYDGSPAFYGYYSPIVDSGYGYTGITDVQNYLTFTTDANVGLGADLPAGNVRVYQEDVDGAALLIGENSIDHTPEGEEVSLYLGNAFDLVGEHIEKNFNFLSSNIFEETIEIKLRNRKSEETVQVRVPERLYRWSDWQIIEASDTWTKLDSTTIEFRVDVEPNTERVITYTVRYTTP